MTLDGGENHISCGPYVSLRPALISPWGSTALLLVPPGLKPPPQLTLTLAKVTLSPDLHSQLSHLLLEVFLAFPFWKN